MILAGFGMPFEGRPLDCRTFRGTVRLFYTVGIAVFFVLPLKQLWVVLGAANVFFLIVERS